MTKLTKDDFKSPDKIKKLADGIHLSPQEFETRFKWTTELI